MTLRPFWRYFGGKWRLAPKYPKPLLPAIIEPFAGAAGYSLRYPDRNIILVERNPIIAAVWRYLIGASPADIRAISLVDAVAELPDSLCQEARWYVGLTMGAGVTAPKSAISAGMRKFRDQGKQTEGWGDGMRDRAASQVAHIKHWIVIEGDYTAAPSRCATWFIDPPYQLAGKAYPFGSGRIDYAALALWCRSRAGQTIVCENYGATWLDFQPLVTQHGVGGKPSQEAIWYG